MYIIDSYDIHAASALGFMTVAGFPFYRNLGVHYTLTILGCTSALMTAVLYTFYRFGPVIRSWSRYESD